MLDGQNCLSVRNINLNNSSAISEFFGLPRRALKRTPHKNLSDKKFFSHFPLFFSLPSCPAFTLAEVLITLGIIGVVASITIPTLINNYQDAALKTAFKKQIALFGSLGSQIATESGGSIKDAYSNLTGNTAIDLYATYNKTLKVCHQGEAEGICWHKRNTWYQSNKTIHSAAGGNFDGFFNQNAAAILNDGSFILAGVNFSRTYAWIGYDWPNCGGGEQCGSWDSAMAYMFDVNGIKPPNTFGKDIFLIHIRDNGSIEFPQGCSTGLEVASELITK